jgi:hypothetical protein
MSRLGPIRSYKGGDAIFIGSESGVLQFGYFGSHLKAKQVSSVRGLLVNRGEARILIEAGRNERNDRAAWSWRYDIGSQMC